MNAAFWLSNKFTCFFYLNFWQTLAQTHAHGKHTNNFFFFFYLSFYTYTELSAAALGYYKESPRTTAHRNPRTFTRQWTSGCTTGCCNSQSDPKMGGRTMHFLPASDGLREWALKYSHPGSLLCPYSYTISTFFVSINFENKHLLQVYKM